MKLQNQDQHRLWSFYQNRHAHSFGGAHARLDFIVNDAMRRGCRGASARVLNIGAGDGYLESRGRQLEWHMYTLDPDDETIRRLRAAGVRAFQGVIEKMPFEADFFDAVVASEVLEHLKPAQLDAGLQEVSRVLKPAGWFLGTVPFQEDLALNMVLCPHCGQVFHRWGHAAAFDAGKLEARLAPFFGVVQLQVRAFVSLRRRKLPQKLKGLVRLALGRFGAAIAAPNIYFAARKVPPGKRAAVG